MSDTISKTCCDDYDPDSLTMDAALQRIEKAIQPVSAYECCNLRMALDRVLAQTITSPINVPAHTNSAMDGYAICGADIPASGNAQLDVVATVMAGNPTQTVINSGQCARIMTGGKIPAGTDTVIMQEHVTRNDNRITIGTGHKAGQNVRQTGEDVFTAALSGDRTRRETWAGARRAREARPG